MGKLVEIDWRPLFGRFFFFAMIRINVKCSNVPRHRIIEMADDITSTLCFLIGNKSTVGSHAPPVSPKKN